MLEWVEGQPIGSAENCSFEGDGAIESMYAEIGRLAGAMHEHSAQWTRPSGFTRQSWNLDGCLGPHALWGHYSALEGLSEGELQLFDRASGEVRARLGAFGEGADRYGLVHGDLVPDNVMQGPQGLVVLDFDDSGFGWYLWEFTPALFWHLGQNSFGPAWRGYLSGYRSRRSLPDEQLRLMPAMFLMRALVYMGWMHTRRETETAAQLRDSVRQTSVKLAEELLAQR
jgi:Ser/Thr protein kinase RdoA (MazF antagonist)